MDYQRTCDDLMSMIHRAKDNAHSQLIMWNLKQVNALAKFADDCTEFFNHCWKMGSTTVN